MRLTRTKTSIGKDDAINRGGLVEAQSMWHDGGSDQDSDMKILKVTLH